MERTKKSRNPLLVLCFAAALGVFGPAAAAQTAMSDGHAYASGALSQISASSVTLNGVEAAVNSETAFIGMTPAGELQSLAWSDFQPGDAASLFTETEDGQIVARSLCRGLLFMVQGQVTALERDAMGNLQSVVVDGAYSIHVSQAAFDFMGAGDMASGMGGNMGGGMSGGGMMGGGGGMWGGGMMGGGVGMSSGDASYVQIGTTLALGGLTENGVFSAVLAHIMGADMTGSGSIRSLLHDDSGHVTGFTMATDGATKQVFLTAATEISKKGGASAPDSLKNGMRVKVSGVERPDGSVLASAVQIKGNRRM